MVDDFLPIERKLRYLFLDLNSYFASCEQQASPELRGKPIAVVPVESDSSFVIAASYEAKRFGIRTGTRIGDARQMCPDLVTVMGRHTLYTHFHQLILQVVQDVLPIDEVCSIDEMRFRLLGEEREPRRARQLALQIKKALYDEVGECMTCSIGIAPNGFLAKVGTELEKPNGLVILEAKDLPKALLGLKLTDFPGINRRMLARLQAVGMFTTEQMCAASEEEMRRAFGSVIGARWHYLLRGFDIPPIKTHRRSLGHSHVLAPELRTHEGCRQVLLRLIQKASARLRSENLRADVMALSVRGAQSWHTEVSLPGSQDTALMNELFLKAWATRELIQPKQVAITFYGLRDRDQATPSLFDVRNDREAFNAAVDTLNRKFGKNTVSLAGMHRAKNAAPERIAFAKTTLFQEGKGDNVWPQPFQTSRA